MMYRCLKRLMEMRQQMIKIVIMEQMKSEKTPNDDTIVRLQVC